MKKRSKHPLDVLDNTQIENMILEIRHSSNNKGVSFEEYKLRTTLEDIEKLEENCKIKKWEFIPIVGAFAYMMRSNFAIYGTDRGVIREIFFKQQFIFICIGLFYVTALILLITPLLQRMIMRKTIVKTKDFLISDVKYKKDADNSAS